MAAPVYQGGGTFASTATKDSALAVPLPPAFAAGHVAFLQVCTVEQGAGNTAPSIVGPASGWRQIGGELHATGFANTRQVRVRWYQRVLQEGDSNPTVQMTGGTSTGILLGARIASFSNVGVVRLAPGNTGDASNITLTGVTSRAADGLAIAFTAIADGNTVNTAAFTDPASPIERHESTAASRLGLSLWTGTKSTAGATGDFVATPSAIDPWAGITMMLEETETFPSEAVLDDFNRADGALGANWAADTFNFSNPAPTIASNQVRGIAGDNRAYYSATKNQVDGQVAVTIPTLPPVNEKVALAYRVRSPATSSVAGFEVETEQTALNGLKAFRIDAGVYSQVGLYPTPLVAGDKIGVRFTGASHEFYIVPASGPKLHIGTLTDAAYQDADGGYAGLTVEGTTVRVDDFALGPLYVPSQVAMAPVMEATMVGQIVNAIMLPGAMVVDVGAAVAVGEGTPISPTEVSFAPVISATMAGAVRLIEQLGRDRSNGYGPQEIVGPLGGGQQDPSVLVRGHRGVKSGRLLARIRR